jgi:hypothetical protein
MISSYVVLNKFFTTQQFEEFLCNYGVDEDISRSEVIYRLQNENSNQNIITNSFTWSDTDEGDEYWNELHERFYYEYEEIIKKILVNNLNLIPSLNLI